jgi:acyl transferase domain-containing protein/acyl carrier protein
MTNTSEDTAIALIGMSGRFPGAHNVSEYWQNLVKSVKSIRFFSDEELLSAGVSPELLAQPNYVKAGATVDDIEMFDASLFKYAPHEAELMDPQHRLFLECAWEALEDAGYDPERYNDLIGVFAGSAMSTYLLRNILPHSQAMNDINTMQAALGNDKDSLASRVSYKLNLRGPSIAVQTYCSTSLVATHLACQSLLNYECDMALAGGVALSIPQVAGYLYEEGGILSPDGACRTFDAQGQGSVMSNGAGVVVLKRFEDALADGDQIYAVLLSSCVNNDGSIRVSYTAPGLRGQTDVIAQAISDAGIETESIGYIEAHGTATMLGDSIELAAMKKAFARTTQKKQFCAIGSVKPNIGHLDRASGVAGLIKAALALKYKVLPPSLDFVSTSEDIDLENSPFYVNTSTQPWEVQDFPRRAGVSSFGIGGTNAHVVLEEAPERVLSNPSSPWQLFLLSAQTEQALQRATHNLATFLHKDAEISLADAAYTLQVGRSAFSHRRFVVGQNRHEVFSALEKSDQTATSAYQVNRDRPAVFLLPGTDKQPTALAQELYQTEPAFRSAYDQCSIQFEKLKGWDIVAALTLPEQAVNQLYQAPITFAIEYALAQLLKTWGLSPQAVLGYGPGALVAGCLAEVFTLEDALKLVAAAGSLSAISKDEQRAELAALVSTFTLRPPTLPLLSPLTGNGLSDQQATDPTYWLQAIGQTEHIVAGIDSLLARAEYVLIEVGQSQTNGQARPSVSEHLVQLMPAFSASQEQPAPRAALLTALGQLWLAGVTIEWQNLYKTESRQRVSLPTYPFERKRYWIEAPHEQKAVAPPPARKKQITDWFYRSRWEQAALVNTSPVVPQNWMIMPDATGVGERIAERLQQQGHLVVRVYPGSHFSQTADAVFQLRPGESDDYTQLCTALAAQQKFPSHVWHGWNITDEIAELATPAETFRAYQEQGFYSLLYLARALSNHLFDTNLHMLVFSTHTQAVTGQETLQPEKATLLGASKVISQEPLNITCRCVDIETDGSDEQSADLVAQYLVECLHPQADQIVAYRAGQRWVQKYEAVPLAPASPETARLRHEGVYLITGGLGGIGLALAAYLAKTVKARLILVGRSPLPARDTWQDLLQSSKTDEHLKHKISSILQIEEQGGVVMLCQADIADDAQIQSVVQSVIEIFGTLHGVFHAAGVTDPDTFKTVDQLTSEDCEIHFHSKVYGTYALQQALAGRDLDFCLLFSSLSAVLGGLGFAAYASANVFLDAVAQRYNQETKQRWLSVNWDTWLVNAEAQRSTGATVAAFAMTPDEGIEALLRVLASEDMHLVHSTGDLEARLRQWVRQEPQLEINQSRFAQHNAAGQFVGEDYEQQITQILQQALGVEHIGLDENFFDLGGNSLIALDVIARLKKVFRRPIPAVALFEAPTISALAEYLRPSRVETDEGADVLQQRRDRARRDVKQDDIAIIGMTCRFPGATNVEQFWQNLCQGVESITSFTDEELLAAGVEPWIVSDPGYVKARPVLDQIDQFDAHFFGYSAREAELTDPQHRLFLECAWEVLEQAGYDCQSYEGLVGVFGGTNISTYLLSLVMSDKSEQLQSIDGFQIVISNDKDSLTTAVSYKLNLRGPSFAVQTFCSTSLVAVHLASQSLLRGECDMALAGGVSIRVPNRVGYMYQEGGQESPDGHCRAFDEQSQGSVLGDGAGIVVLKRLADALEDGDTIHAVIKGSAVNNDGSLKVSYSAPSVIGQANVVTQVLQDAKIPAESIGYIEAHGTGTSLGDPIELASLTKAFRTQTDEVGFCPIGSLKTNVGHLDRAAGVAGLIKAAMVLKHGLIPPTLHFQAPNPEIDFANSPFFVNTQLLPWPQSETPRRAGVNSLGMGGTNAHVIIEAAPAAKPASPPHPWQLLVWSAKTETALQTATRNLQQYLQEQTEVNLTDVAHTLQRGRNAFAHRRVLVCRNAEEALTALNEDANQFLTSCQERRNRKVAFLFPGVGEQTEGLTHELYETEPVFRETVDYCCTLVKRFCDLDLHHVLYPEKVQNGNVSTVEGRLLLSQERSAGKSTSVIRRTDLAQPAVFVLEYALAKLFMQWGISPQVMLGYSLGEYVVACLAGVFSLEDALMLVTRRAQLIHELPESTLLVVALSEEEVQPYLTEQISLAIVNAPHTCVLGGPSENIALLATQLRASLIACSIADTSHAFHTPMLHSLREQFIEVIENVSLQAPNIPYISNVSGTWITAEQATDPAYWANHMCQTVRFADGVKLLLEDTEYVFLEVGPGQALSSFVRQNSACKRERFSQVISTLAGYEARPEAANVLLALGKLWLAGVTPDWSGLYKGEHRRRLPLPTYPFERQSYWIATQNTSSSQRVNPDASPETIISRLKLETLADWFYVPGWKSAAPLPVYAKKPAPKGACWLFFLDEYGLGRKLAEQLQESGEESIIVSPAREFARLDGTHYTLNPLERADYTSLFNDLRARGKNAWQMVHLWSIGEYDQPVEEALNYGFYSVFALAQAFGDADAEQSQLSILSNYTQNVTGSERVLPARATLVGPCHILPQEYPNLQCRGIDIVLPQSGSQQEKALIHQLVSEITSMGTETLVALRANHRWLPTFDAMHVESQQEQVQTLRREGVYLITGGLGGIGLALARFLAQEYQAKLALLGRSGLPACEQWPQILADENADKDIRRRIQHIQELEALGAEVLVLQADVRNREQMQSAIEQIQGRFGCLHGVLHTAGVPGVGLTQFKTVEQVRGVLGPKVEGTLILEEVLAETPVELLVLFSSMTARMGGGPGQVDYSAANAFLGAYAQNWQDENRQVVAIDWGEWQWNAWEAGLAGYDSQVQSFFRENRRKFGIAFEDGSEALRRVLATKTTNMVVSTQNFPTMVAQSKRLTAAYAAGKGRTSRQNQETYPRPELVDSYMPARNNLEQQIVELWEDLLGVIPVGVNDNFFELGGNSLIGIDLITRLRKMLQLETVAAHMLYEAPTISKMALYIENGTSTQGVQKRLARGEKRRESQKQRILHTKGEKQSMNAEIVVNS